MSYTKLFVLAALVAITTGCTNTPTMAGTVPTRETPEQFHMAHNALAMPALPEGTMMHVGDMVKFPLPTDTTWKSSNQSVLTVAVVGQEIVVIAVGVGKAQICGTNNYFPTQTQNAWVNVQ